MRCLGSEAHHRAHCQCMDNGIGILRNENPDLSPITLYPEFSVKLGVIRSQSWSLCCSVVMDDLDSHSRQVSGHG